MVKLIRFLLLALMLPLSAFAAPYSSSHVKVELLQEEESIQPGTPFWVAVHLDIEEGWHVYWKNPGDAGMPLKIEWKLPPGFQVGPLQWPFPEKFTLAEMVGFGYKGEVTLLSLITPPKDLALSDVNLTAQVRWLVCSDLNCQPGSAPATLTVKALAGAPHPRQDAIASFISARAKMPKSFTEARTIWKEGAVQIEVPESERSHINAIVGAYFFPEQKDMIDHTVNPTLIADASDDPYLVNLKSSQVGATGKKLKGVLVLHTKKGVTSFDIDSSDEKPLAAAPVISNISKTTTTTTPSVDGRETTISIGHSEVTPTSDQFAFSGGVGYALLLAFVGGMILNLMPCVLPVLSFKVMSFIKMSGESRSLTIKHGLVFSFGVLASFWILATAMLVLREYGQAVGWGFQLQEPIFVVILASLLFIFALNLFGVFELGLAMASWAGQTQADSQKAPGYVSSFLSGVLATAVATPCTGPFLGSAVGFAFTLPIPQAMLIFTSLGLGMCFPYLLLATFPGCLKFIPKPGAWMETFKQLMGFILLATVVWLLWVFSAQTNTLSLMCILAGLLFFSMGAWIYGKGSLPSVRFPKRMIAYIFVCLFAVAGVEAIILPYASWYQEAPKVTQISKGETAVAQLDNGWETFSPERVAQLRAEGKPILIDFTAKWCLICQANLMVISSNAVEKQIAESGVVKMKADWTRNDPVIGAELAKFGRNSVPLYLLYGSNGEKDPVILPQVLTPGVITSKINEMVPEKVIALE